MSEDDWNKNHHAHQIPIFIYSHSLCLRCFLYLFISTSTVKKKKLREKSIHMKFSEKMRLNWQEFEYIWSKHNRKNQWNEKIFFLFSFSIFNSVIHLSREMVCCYIRVIIGLRLIFDLLSCTPLISRLFNI